jgi:hypothetical protein
LAERIERLFHLRDDVHLLATVVIVDDMRLVLVAFLVMRLEQFGRHALAGVERGVEGLARVVGVARPAGQGADFEQFVQDELEVAAREYLGLHGSRVSQAARPYSMRATTSPSPTTSPSLK